MHLRTSPYRVPKCSTTWLVLFIVCSCTGSRQPSVEGVWQGVEVQSEHAVQELEARLWLGPPPSRRLQGSGPCNDFQGTYELVGRSLRPVAVAASVVDCGNDLDAEEVLLEMLWSDSVDVLVMGADDELMIWTLNELSIRWNRVAAADE